MNTCRLVRGLLAGLSLAVSTGLLAAPVVQVVGLFPEAAVLKVDGQRRLVRVGQTGPAGIVVVRIEAQGAVLRVEGRERSYPLGRDYGTGYAAPAAARTRIARGPGGHYWVTGTIDGQTVPFLVDTGATSVAMSEPQARRLGIDYRVRGQPLHVNTASGSARAWKLRLDRVEVGGVAVLGVDAVVLEGNAPAEALLGMSFLNQVYWREEQGQLLLESKLP